MLSCNQFTRRRDFPRDIPNTLAADADDVTLLGEPQSKVANHLACLRWRGFVATRREHRTIHYRLADQRVAAAVELGRALLHDNTEHIVACGRVDWAGC